MSDSSDLLENGLSPVESAEEEEPVTTGTLVILMLFLMALGALWGLMYLMLLER